MKIGEYEVVEELGFGGMGQVHLARRRGPGDFEKWVAIKTLHPHLARQDEFVRMFLDEARIAARMSHPNVAQVFELGESEGSYFLAMEYLEGVDLADLWEAAEGPMPPRVAASIVARAARGLHYAHEKEAELVHRDVSPKNVILTFHGDVKVTDFGIAKVRERASERTETGHVKGKCAYLSPEQAAGEEVDRRTDVFALGIVLWELLSGERLFKAPTDAETVVRIVEHRVPPLEADPELVAIAERALAAEREDRFATAEEMADALEATGVASSTELAAFVRGAVPEREEASSRLRQRAAEAMTRTRVAPAPEASGAEGGTGETLAATPSAKKASRSRWGGLLLASLVLAVLAVAIVSTRSEEPRLRVVSNPQGAWVEVDGERRGTTPASIALTRGRHHVRVGHEGFVSLDEHVELEGHETLRLRLSRSEPALGRDEPIRADVGEAGEDAEHAGEAGEDAERERGAGSGGEHLRESENEGVVERGVGNARRPEKAARRLVAEDSRRGAAMRAATSNEGAEREEDSERAREREPALLNLLSRPWATVRINGRDFGRTPLLARPIEPGVTNVELRAEGEGDPVRRRFTAVSGETVNLRVDL